MRTILKHNHSVTRQSSAAPDILAGHGLESGAESGTNSRQAPVFGMTRRALLIGVLLIPVLCLWVEYSEIVSQATDGSGFSLLFPAVFVLFALTLANQAVRRFAPRYALSQSELLTIYIMCTIGVTISGIGMMQLLVPMLGNVFYFATPGNQWAEKFGPYLKPWLFPNPSVIRAFYTGQSSFLAPANLVGWLPPIISWSAFLFVFFGVMLCINVLLRRQWIQKERLSFPIVTLPIEMTRQDEVGRLLINRLLWSGFAVSAILQTLATLHDFYPSIPFVPLKPSDPRLNISPLFSQPPWNGVGYLALSFHPMVIALIYFVAVDFSFSLWFFYLLAKMVGVMMVTAGYGDPGTGFSMNTSDTARFGEQGAGAFLTLALFSLYSARGHLAATLREVFAPRTARSEPDEAMPSRRALIGAVGGIGALTAFGMAIGMAWYVPLLFFAVYYAFLITLTRIRAEVGVPWSFAPDMSAHDLFSSAGGVHVFSAGSLAGLAIFQWFDVVHRSVPMPYQMEAFKMADGARMNNRHIVRAILIATVVGILASWWSLLMIYYHYGAASAHVHSWRTDVAKVPWNTLQEWMGSRAPANRTRMEAVCLGGLITVGLLLLRSRFVAWPLHPLGYALAGTFTMPWIWCAVFLGWLIKMVVLRYGGMRTYRSLIPFFIGVILGECVTAAFWAAYGALAGVTVYRTFPY